MNKKNLVLTAALLCLGITCASAQMTVTKTNYVTYTIPKNTAAESFELNGKVIFILHEKEGVNDHFTTITLEKNSNSLHGGNELTIPGGILKNSFDIHSFKKAGSTLYAFIENRNKSEDKSTLFARAFNEDGTISKDGKEIGSMPYTKFLNPPAWLTCVSPDGNHLAFAGIFAKDKEGPQLGKYFFTDANLNVISSGDFSIDADKKKYFDFRLYASDKGDIYLVDADYVKRETSPVVYSKPASEKTFTPFRILFPEKQKNKCFTSIISPTGSLVVVGYTQPSEYRFGDTLSTGIYVYDTEKSPQITTLPFDKPVTNMALTSVAFNNGTLFITGEQMLRTADAVTTQNIMSFDENFNYKFGNILITGYDMENNTKYDLPLSRSMNSRNYTADIRPAAGILNGRYTIIYNDDLKKYLKTDSYVKVPLTADITNEGLLEQPVHYEKEFDVRNSGYVLNTAYYHFSDKEVIVLLSDGSAVKAVRMKQ